MNIKTKQIIDYVELITSKFIENVNEEDLKKVEELTIDEFDIVGEKTNFYIEDLELFPNLKSLSFNRMIINEEILNYVKNSNINELNLYNCELVIALNSKFDNITTLRIEYVDNFEEDYLQCFPNVKNLTFKGYTISKQLPKDVNRLDMMNSKLEDTNIISKSKINDLYVSKDEYENHKDFYSRLIINVNVYDENNCYLVNKGDKDE